MGRPLNEEKKGHFSLIKFTRNLLFLFFVSGIVMFFTNIYSDQIKQIQQKFFPSIYGTPPLVMEGGDPYLRALMRTISASEASFMNPYHVLYTGKHVEDLSSHPNQCLTIVRGPNKGQCTTAAGRYQFLNQTWYEKAARYHPKANEIGGNEKYSFEPKYQDIVLYSWLNDSNAWNFNISELLQQGKIEEVLERLSPTWTSLGYGIEDNSTSKHLPKIYRNMLEEELNRE